MKPANSSISLKNIRITDTFWNKYIHLVKEVIIPYQWDILNDRLDDVETSHCIENFKIAAGESEGEFCGAVFQDTDVAKWLEAVGFVLNYGRDEELEKLADETIELIGRAQQPDGYLNTYFTIKEPGKRWSNIMEGHELYTAGHMIEAAVAYFESTGKRRFLDIVCKFADLIAKTFGPNEGQIHAYPGHQEIELALVKLYRVTDEKKYLDLAKYFIDARGVGDNYFKQEEKRKGHKFIFPEFMNYDTTYSQSDRPVRSQKTAQGHAVRANYMYSAMADLAYEYDDKELLESCERLWNDMVHKQMYITGSVGASGILERFTTDYDLPNDCNYSETCATIALAMFGKRMGDMKKDASYIEVVERALYNTLLSGIAMDGKSFFYVNPLEVWPANCIPHTSKEHVKPVRQKWFGVACCPPNITRTLASLGQYVYFHEDDEIFVNMYVSNETNTTLGGKDVKFSLVGNFPWENKIMFTVKADEAAKGTISFRIPQYASGYKIMKGTDVLYEDDKTKTTGKTVNNVIESTVSNAGTNNATDISANQNNGAFAVSVSRGYAKITGEFRDEVFNIEFDAKPVFVHANPNVRADAGKTAIMKGPLVYCIEEVDNGDNLASIFVDSTKPISENYTDDILGGCSVISLKGKKLSTDGWDESKLYEVNTPKLTEVNLKAVPYCYWGNRQTGEMLVWIKESL